VSAAARRWASETSAYNDSVERDVFESNKRAVVYLDLLGFAALVEANPQYFATEPFDDPSLRTVPTNAAAQRLTLFHQVLESNIASEQPNHATVFSDCGFGVFYTPKACAEFAVALMQDFLRVKVPVRMGLGFGTFSALGTTSSITGRSTVVRAMFGGTSIVRAVAAERCGGKGMRIFADSSFSELFKIKRGDRGRRLSSEATEVGDSCQSPRSLSPSHANSIIFPALSRRRLINGSRAFGRWRTPRRPRSKITTRKRWRRYHGCLCLTKGVAIRPRRPKAAPIVPTPLRSSYEAQTENDFAIVFIGSKSLSLSSGSSMKTYFR
jgi:hypothetical protein